MSMGNLLLTGRTKKNLLFSAACIGAFAVFCLVCAFAGRAGEDDGMVDGEAGDFMEEIDLSKYSFGGMGGPASMEEPFMFSDECITVSGVSKRASKVFFIFQFNGMCSGDCLTLTFKFDNGRKEVCSLDAFVGGQRYLLNVPFPKNSREWELTGVGYSCAGHSLSECMYFGDEKTLALEGVNTLRYKDSCKVLIYSKDGIVLDFLELEGNGSTVISPGAAYYRYLF